MSRSKMKVRRQVKVSIGEGASERELRDEMDSLVRQIVFGRDEYPRECIVCGINETVIDLHVGHFITRKVLALRWDLRNVWPQCDEDNQEHNTRPEWYRSMLIMMIGESEVCELDRIAQENPHVDYAQLLTIRGGLKAELARLKL